MITGTISHDAADKLRHVFKSRSVSQIQAWGQTWTVRIRTLTLKHNNRDGGVEATVDCFALLGDAMSDEKVVPIDDLLPELDYSHIPFSWKPN